MALIVQLLTVAVRIGGPRVAPLTLSAERTVAHWNLAAMRELMEGGYYFPEETQIVGVEAEHFRSSQANGEKRPVSRSVTDQPL